MNIDLGGAANQLLPTILSILFGIMCVATPIGFGVAMLVRRTMPVVTALNAAIVCGYVVAVVVLYVVLRRVAGVGMYEALTVSVVVAAGIVAVIWTMLRRYLASHVPDTTVDQDFSVFGEDVRGKRKKPRR